jgi:hypothetical protein
VRNRVKKYLGIDYPIIIIRNSNSLHARAWLKFRFFRKPRGSSFVATIARHVFTIDHMLFPFVILKDGQQMQESHIVLYSAFLISFILFILFLCVFRRAYLFLTCLFLSPFHSYGPHIGLLIHRRHLSFISPIYNPSYFAPRLSRAICSLPTLFPSFAPLPNGLCVVAFC